VSKLFDTLAPRFASRPGGYTRLLRLGYRKGDSAESRKWSFAANTSKAKAETPAKTRPRSQSQGRRWTAEGGRRTAPRKEKNDQPVVAKSRRHSSSDAHASRNVAVRVLTTAWPGSFLSRSRSAAAFSRPPTALAFGFSPRLSPGSRPWPSDRIRCRPSTCAISALSPLR